MRLCFPGKAKSVAEPTALVEETRTASGITVIPHDLRRTFATVAERLDLSLKTVKSLLNHRMDDDVTAGYVISETERLRSAMQRITNTLCEMIEIEEKPDVEKAKNGSKAAKISSHRKKNVEF